MPRCLGRNAERVRAIGGSPARLCPSAASKWRTNRRNKRNYPTLHCPLFWGHFRVDQSMDHGHKLQQMLLNQWQ
nr:MAG TPA: hypothetical protein [Caudoviricetes sp.]